MRSKKLLAVVVLGMVLGGLTWLLSSAKSTGNGGRLVAKPAETFGFTVVIREFEHWRHRLVETTASLSAHLPGVKILVVTDSPLYPPVNFGSDVKVLTSGYSVHQDYDKSFAEAHITTEFAVFVPDNTLLFGEDATRSTALSIQQAQSSVQQILRAFESKDRPHVVIAPITPQYTSTSVLCSHLHFDFRNWTLTQTAGVHQREAQSMCSLIPESSLVAVRTKHVKLIQWQQFRPLNLNLAIQASGKRWNVTQVIPNFEGVWLQGPKLFEDEHSQYKISSSNSKRLTELYSALGVKRVVHDRPGASDEWHGCTRQSSRCFGTIKNDTPEYIYAGRWTPPCCLQHLRETLHHVLQLFRDDGIRYWLEGGSLLGAVRHGDIIPWDYDIDLGIFIEDMTRSQALRLLLNDPTTSVTRAGFVWEKAPEGDFYRVQYSQSNHLHVDIFPFQDKNGIMTKVLVIH